MKSKLTLSIICLFMLSSQLFAQRTVTNRLCVSCIPYEQYQINANGNYHGTYKTWNKQGRLSSHLNYLNGDLHGICIIYFDNGTVKEETTYYKGIKTRMKVYAYNENCTKRTLVRDATWDKSGKVLTDGDNAGLLPNGRWQWNYPEYGYYSETYNRNDTVYVWYDKSKQKPYGKYIHDVFIECQERINERIKLIQEELRQDSILEAKHIEEQMYKETQRDLQRKAELAKEQACIDSINTLKQAIHDTDALYTKLLDENFNGNEYTFYERLCKYVLKKRNADVSLQTMLTDIIGIKHSDIHKHKFIISWHSTDYFSQNGIYVIENNMQYDKKRYMLALCKNINLAEIDVYRHNTQQQLIGIIQYAKEHNIKL